MVYLPLQALWRKITGPKDVCEKLAKGFKKMLKELETK